jgi:hypothetical protein
LVYFVKYKLSQGYNIYTGPNLKTQNKEEPKMNNKGSDSGFNLSNWVLGIAATVIAAILITVLTPLVKGDNEKPISTTSVPMRQVDMKILDFPKVTLAYVSTDTAMQVNIHNEGNTAAESCQVQLNNEGVRLTNSSFFGVVAGATETIALTLRPFDRSLEFTSIAVDAEVICTNGRSPVYRASFAILP